MFSQLTLSHRDTVSVLPQSSGCRVFITFGFTVVSDSITQPACVVTVGVPWLRSTQMHAVSKIHVTLLHLAHGKCYVMRGHPPFRCAMILTFIVFFTFIL